MYGYIKYSKEEMKVKHIRLYSKYYCVLCTELGKKLGILYRFFTSYDITAFMLFFDSIANCEKQAYKIKCPLNHRKNGTVMISPCAVDYSLVVCLFWVQQKIEDNLIDEKSSIWRFVDNIFKKNNFFQNMLSESYIDKWKKLLNDYFDAEKDDNSSFDELTNLIGNAYGEVFRDFIHLYNLDFQEDELFYIGFNIGKFIYIMDAYDDYHKDIQSSKFNPICRMIDYETIKNDKNLLIQKIGFLIQVIVSKINKIVETNTYESNDQTQIFINIIQYGMIEMFERISEKKYR